MFVRTVDDKPSDTLVVVSGEGFWTGSSTLPHLHHSSVSSCHPAGAVAGLARTRSCTEEGPDRSPVRAFMRLR
jgi:hypothetical protein